VASNADKQIRVADYISNYLDEIGVRTAFMLSGGFMMHLMDSVSRKPNIKYYCCHHEQACAMAADAYSRMTGHLGVCYATSGPAATNLLTGLVEAWQDSSPVLFFTGQSKRIETVYLSGIEGVRQVGFLEVNIVPIVKSVTKYATMLDDPQMARYHLEKAVKLATTGRPGPVLLDCPLDVQGALIDPDTLAPFDEKLEIPGAPSTQDLADTIADLKNAKRPVLLAGYGIRAAGATDLFRRLAARLQVPVLTTQFGTDLMLYDDPIYVGHAGVKGDRAGNFAVQSADVILSIGCSLHNQTIGYEAELFAPHAKKIQVELDPTIMKRERARVTRKILAESKAFLEALDAAWKPGPSEQWNSWRERCRMWKAKYSSESEPHRLGGPNDVVNCYEIAHVLNELTDGTETIVSDAGQPYYILGQALRPKGTQRYLAAAALAGMGWGLPASVGAAVAEPSRNVIAFIGDGSFHMNVQELQTIRHNNLNIKIIVVLNDGYASIRNTQNSFFAGHLVGSSCDSGVSLPDLDLIAAAFKIPHMHCHNRSELRGCLTRMLATEGPIICGIDSQVDQVIIPGVPSTKLPDGRMVSRPLHEMAPLLSEEETRENMTF
jgi:acetolactate synthase I/II/III large subunit